MNQELKDILFQHGWIRSTAAELTPLTGGVSSEIYLVVENDKRFVIKRALNKLKVKDDWYADTARNYSEQAYMRYVSSFRPEAMPKVLGSDAGAGLFIMEYLSGFKNWKQILLAGQCDITLAYNAGKLLGEIHSRSWGDRELLEDFDLIQNFDQLRIDPYLRILVTKYPKLKTEILAEAGRLTQSRQCLIHGDYSPKNILFNQNRLVPLDCEVACFADAAFDLSFFLNHLFLKSCYHAPEQLEFVAMINAARTGYGESNPEHVLTVESNTVRLLPMLMLARIDGKSPVDYLNTEKQIWVRNFSIDQISINSDNLDRLQTQWFQKLYSGN